MEKNFEVVDSILNTSYELFGTDTIGMGKVYIARARLAGKLGNTNEIISNTLKAKVLFEKSGDVRGTIICATNVGVTFTQVKQYREALNYFYLVLSAKRKTKFQPKGSPDIFNGPLLLAFIRSTKRYHAIG